MTDHDALTLTIWGEARGEPIEGKVGVAAVIRNRVQAHYRGATTYLAVCLAHAQFSAWTDEAAAMKAEEVALAGSSPDPTLKLCGEIAAATIAGVLPDPTHGANHYYAISLTTPPAWAVGQTPLVTLGRQHFYNVP
jgi:spore germination cell wall hydrolase CwlJ-like protein